MNGHLREWTAPGLHGYLARLLPELGPGHGAAVDLGAGSGAIGLRLRDAGYDVLCCDRDASAYGADLPFTQIDLDEPDFAARLGEGRFALVTAVEVIEHLESSIGFLRNIRSLLAPGGVAVVTTPNLDSVPARLKFLLKGKLRLMDEHGDATHVTPIFWDLLTNRYLPRARLELVAHHVYPPTGFVVGRPLYRPILRGLSPIFRRGSLLGDNHVLALAREER